MSREDFLRAVGEIDGELLERFIQDDYQKQMAPPPRHRSHGVIRGIMAAAVMCVVVSLIVTVTLPIFRWESPIDPWMPSGDAWVPEIDESVPEIRLYAIDARRVFPDILCNYGSYEKVTGDLSKQNLHPIPQAEWLPIYVRDYDADWGEADFISFIDRYADAMEILCGDPIANYTVEKATDYLENVYYSVDFRKGNAYSLSFYQGAENRKIRYSLSGSDRRMKLQNEYVMLSANDDKEAIRQKLKPVVEYLNTLFGKNYTDMSISRSTYSTGGKEYCEYSISLYLEDSSGESNHFYKRKAMEYLSLKFSAYRWHGSQHSPESDPDVAYLDGLNFVEYGESLEESIVVAGKSRMLSLTEAEELLRKGYVFGGGNHACSLCGRKQNKVSFSDYAAVGFVYQTNSFSGLYIPFYVFFQDAGYDENGDPIYIMTRVPAVEVEGLEEYFEKQKEYHR